MINSFLNFKEYSLYGKDCRIYDNLHYIFSPKNNNISKNLISQINHISSDILSEEINDLSKLHNYINSASVNNFRINLYKRINNEIDWMKKIKDAVLPYLINIMGPDLVIQTNINLSIQLPDDRSSILPAHSDCISSDSPFQFNLWIPLTKSYKTNSMFLLSKEKSLSLINDALKSEYRNILSVYTPSDEEFIEMNPGEYLLFQPSVIHGNVLNKTSKTRVSLNVRIKSIFTPESLNNNQDRNFGTYYKLFNLSASTKYSIKISDLFNR